MALTINTLQHLTDLKNHNGSWSKQMKSTQVTDTFDTITNGGNIGDGLYGPDYLVQNLVPNTLYRLKFKIFKPDGASGWTDVLGASNYIRPADVTSTVTINTIAEAGATSAGSFYWSSADTLSRELLFITSKDDGSNITGSGFGNTRATYNYAGTSGPLYNLPPSGANYNNFVSNAKSFVLGANGLPSNGYINPGFPPSLDQFDAVLFLFEKPATTPANPNLHYSNQVFAATPTYVGVPTSNPTTTPDKGFKVYKDINTEATGGSLAINIVDSDFATGGIFESYNSGRGLYTDREYVAGLMLINITSKYIVKDVNNNVKWFTNVIPLGGVWSITLGEFFRASAVDGQMSDATSVAVRVDSIGTQGSVAADSQFRIQIYAEPYVP